MNENKINEKNYLDSVSSQQSALSFQQTEDSSGAMLAKEPAHRKANSSKNLFWSLALIFVLALFGYVMFLYLIKSKAEHFGEIVSTLEERVKKEQEFRNLRSVVADTEALREGLNEYLVSKEEIVSVIENIEGLGTHAQVSVVFDTVNVVRDSTPPFLRLQFRAGGNFESIFYFLSLLESFPLKISF